MVKLNNEIVIIILSVIGCLLYYIIVSTVRSLFIKKGLANKVNILIDDNFTYLIDDNGVPIADPIENIVKYKNGVIISIGSIRLNNDNDAPEINFIKENDELVKNINNFWEKFVFILSLEIKRKLKLHGFVIPSFSIKIGVTSDNLVNNICNELVKLKNSSKGRAYNLMKIEKER